MMKCFISEVKRVAIDKLCWGSKIKDRDYMIAVNVWDHVQNDFNIKYIANNKQKINLMENSLQSHVIFKYPSVSK